MSGHSKWANIQHRKKAQDARRGKLFTRLIREITIAARLGGHEPGANPRLRLALDKAAAANLGREPIDRAIKRGAGLVEGRPYESVQYEGYGPAGTAVLVDCATDNRNRTVAEVRNVFTRHGGSLGENGSVAYLFERRGVLGYGQADEDTILEAALEVGADDVVGKDGAVWVFTVPEQLFEIGQAMGASGFAPDESELGMVPTSLIEIGGEDGDRLVRMLDSLEELEDVQNIYCNANLSDTPWLPWR